MPFLSRIYQKVIIAVDLDEKSCRVRITYHNSKSLKPEERVFKTVNADFPIEAVKHIRRIQRKFPYTYVATISKCNDQGLIKGNKLGNFADFGLNVNLYTVMLVNKKWFIYIAKDELNRHKAKFSKIYGIDFIFSPFVIIYEKIKNRLEDSKKLYILQEKHSTALLIANNEGVYLGNYILFEYDKFVDEAKEEISKNGDVIEFDAINDIDENIIIKDFDEHKYEAYSAGLNEISIANHMTDVIKNTLNNFYKDDRYSSDFIDELFVLDAYGITDNTITHLNNNTMLDTHFVRIDVCEEIEKLVKMELKL